MQILNPAVIALGKTQQTGQFAEDLACKYLQQHGMQLITRNYRCKTGEIDLIMQEREVLVFVEVRYRSNLNFVSGIESITAAKQMKLIRAANYYLQQQNLSDRNPCRFDVIGITSQGVTPQVEWVKNAFTT